MIVYLIVHTAVSDAGGEAAKQRRVVRNAARPADGIEAGFGIP